MSIDVKQVPPDTQITIKHKDLLALCVTTLEAHLGVRIYVTQGGPSCADPAGEVENYIGIRDPHGEALAIGINYGKHIFLVGSNGRSAK